MKKFVIGLIIGSLITGTAGAAAQYALTPITYDIKVNGKSLKDEQYPMLNWNGTTYLSLRKTSEAFGAKLNWNSTDKIAELTTSQTPSVPTTSVNVTTSGSQKMKSDFMKFNEEPVMYVIYDNEYYIEMSAFSQYLTSDANNCYIKIPGKGEVTLPKEPGSDKLKSSKSVIEYLFYKYVRIGDLNFTTEIKDNMLWLK